MSGAEGGPAMGGPATGDLAPGPRSLRHDPIGPNVEMLQRTRALVASLDEVAYTHVERQLTEASIGAHVRHVLDHYRLFLDGLPDGRIDYDRRQRETAVESDPRAALGQIDELIVELRELTSEALGRRVLVRQQGSYDAGRFEGGESFAERELLFLQSHTVHHHALIAVLARAQHLGVPETFGVAPSTVAWRRSQGGAAAAPPR